MRTTLSRKERVRQGGLWLDVSRSNWSTDIESALLNADSVWNCVLGQLFSEPNPKSRFYGSGFGRCVGRYDYGLPQLTNQRAMELGFADPWDDERYDLLTRYWREEVAVRQRGVKR